MANNNSNELLTCEEALEYLRCGYNTLYRLLKEGKLHAFKEGRIWKIPVTGINLYIEERSKIHFN